MVSTYAGSPLNAFIGLLVLSLKLLLESQAHIPGPLPARLIIFCFRPHRHNQAVEVVAAVCKAAYLTRDNFRCVEELPCDN